MATPPISDKNISFVHPPWESCQVCNDAKQITTLSQSVNRIVRKLRRDLKACDSCLVGVNACPLLQNLNSTIQSAIQQVVDEWQLNSE